VEIQLSDRLRHPYVMKYSMSAFPACAGCAGGHNAARFVALLALAVAAVLPAIHAAPPLQVVSVNNTLYYNSSPNEVIPRTIEYTLSGATVNLQEKLPDGTIAVTNGITKVRVLLPVGYESGANYPVVYLLHGFNSNYQGWSNMNHVNDVNDTLETNTRAANIVFVMPDGGGLEGGFYSNWYESPDGLMHDWETYHIEQLIPWVEANFKVQKTRAGRAISGLSMGGFGCTTYASRHPDLFAGVFSISGAVNNIPITALGLVPEDLESLNPMLSIDPSAIWGPYLQQEVLYRGRNPMNLIDNLRPLTVWVRTGLGWPGGTAPGDGDKLTEALEAGVGVLNEAYDINLGLQNVPHTYTVNPQGTHTGYHFLQSFKLALPVMQQTFAANVPVRPAGFNYRSIEPSFSIFDWQFSATRDVIEFLYLSDVSRDGLKLKGSGTVAVTTPPVYNPGSHHWVLAPGQAGIDVWPNWPKADDEGRLHFNVKLGNSHTLQQYTAAQRLVEAAALDYWKDANVQIW